MWVKIGSLLLALLMISTWVGCGGGSSTAAVTLTSIVVTPGASTLAFGHAEQFTATGHFSNGNSHVLASGVAWQSSATSVATISGTGLATSAQHGQTTITATKNGVSGNTTLTVSTELLAIGLTPIGPGIAVGGATQQFTAIGSFDDATTQDLTSTASWNSSDITKATISGAGVATGVAPGAVTVTVIGTAVSGASVSASTALNVVIGPGPALNGSYAFTLTSADTRGPQFFAGSFTADGTGLISGVEDANTGAGVNTSVGLTGSYTLYPDGRGSITLNPEPLIYPSGITLRFILSADGSTGRLVQFDGQGTARGEFEKQDSDAFSTGALIDNFVFRVGGIDASNNPLGVVGIFNLDGNGGVTDGTVDANDFGTVTVDQALSSATYSVDIDASGRGSLQLINGAETANFVLYVVNAQKVNLIQTDAAPATALAGVAEKQDDQIFTILDVSGGYAYLLDRPVVVGTGGNADRREFAQVGFWNFNNVTAQIDGIRDDANNGSANPILDIAGGYAVGGIGVNGRGTVHVTGGGAPPTSDRSYIFYMVSTDRMLVLQTFTGSAQSAGSLNAPTGVAVRQTGTPFTLGSLKGAYALDASDLTATYTAALLSLQFDGAGGISGIADVSASGTVSSTVIAAGYGSPATKGRATINLPGGIPANAYVFYLTSPQSAFVLGVTPPATGSIIK